MKKTLMMLLGIAFSSCVIAANVELQTSPYAAVDKTPAKANASWYSGCFLDKDLVAQLMGKSVNLYDSAVVDAFEKWLVKDFASNSSAIKSAAKVKVTCTDYFAPNYMYSKPDPSVPELYAPTLAVYFFNNGKEEVYGVALALGYHYESGDAEADTGWKTAPKGPIVSLGEVKADVEDWSKFNVAYAIDNLKEGVDYKVLIDVTAGGVTKSITNATAIVNGSFTNTVDTAQLFGSKVVDEAAKVVLSLEAGGAVVSSSEKTFSILPPPGDIYAITPLSESGKIYKAGEKVKFQVRLLSRNYDTPTPTAYQLVYTGSGTEAEDMVSNPPMLGIVVSGQLRGAKIVEVKPAAITGDQTVNPYTDLICEYVVQSGDLALPINLVLDGSTENLPIVPDSANAVSGFGYCLINGDKWDIRPANGSKSANPWFTSSSTANMAKGFWNQLGTAVVDYKLAQADFQVNTYESVEYLDWDAGTKSLVAVTNQFCEVVTTETATFESNKWYVVTNTIERAGIKVNGEAHLILCDGSKLKVTGNANKAGIEVPADKSLTIYGQSEGTGKLEASSAMLGAGIGGSSQGSCGAITINGGTIKATGGAGGAGIGGGMAGTSAATITINGGEIEAIGGTSSAGIGSGVYNGFSVSRIDTDLITINGGTIKATGGQWAAGIGSGESGFAATVVINGGEITASTEYADAIGSGFNAKEAATVIFGTAMASKHVWAGASASNGVTMTTAAFATMHRMTYVELPVEIYTVTYDANGATGTMSNSVFAVSKEVTLKKNAFTAVGYDFAGWTTNGTNVVYADEAKDTDFATTNATLTLYAKWNANTNGVTATSFTNLVNTIEKATEQASTLPITIGFTSKVEIPESATLPTLPTGTGFSGIKYVGDEEVGSNLYIEDGVLYGSAMRGEVTVDALRLMRYAMGGSISSFQAISEGETTVTNAVVMLLGDNGKAYFNDTDDVDQMIADILAADPRPTTVKLFEVKGAMVTFEAMGGILENGTESTTYLCLPDTGYVLPDEVEREGYTLKGWFDSWKPGANEITNNQVIVDYAPQSLYAQWTSTAPTPKADELHISDVTNNVPVTEIAAKAYVNKTSVKTVTTPLYLKKICNRAFMGCTALEKLTITATRDYETLEPTKVTIEQNAFSGCTSLEELLIAGDIEKIGQSAFQNCAKLKKIIFRGDEAIAYDPGAFYRCGYANGTDELKVYMSSAFQAANAQLISDFQSWNTQVKIIDKIGVEPVTGETTVSLDPASLVAGKRVAIVVQTSVKGTPDKEDVDIELSTDLATWTPITEGVEKTAYPDGTVMIEITVPNAPSAFFRAVVKEN